MTAQHHATLSLVLISAAVFLFTLATRPPETAPEQGPTLPRAQPAPVAEVPRGGRKAGARAEIPAPLGAPAQDPGLAGRTLDAAAEAARPAVQACVHAWVPVWLEDEVDELEGQVRVELRVGPSGLSGAALLDVEGVPYPMLKCLGEAVYRVAWPQLPVAESVVMELSAVDAH